MKVLIIQLARYGDILQTIPIINSIKRNNKESKVDVLVRSKYSAAIKDLGIANKVECLDTKNIISPIFSTEDFQEQDFWASLNLLDTYCSKLKSNEYDKIINLSFSPFSSYLTYFLSNSTKAEVRGYNRFSDGFLNLSDDPSAYFYAQVGINRFNRFHIIDLFATVADTEVRAEDYKINIFDKRPYDNDYIILHLGASSSKKALPPNKWNQIIRSLQNDNEHIIVIGTKEEESLVAEAFSGISENKYSNLAGKTNFKDLFNLIKYAKYYIGADSGPLHLCNFFNTKCFNISNKEVNYFETGPKSKYSYVWYEDNFHNFDAPFFVENLKKALNEKKTIFIRPDEKGSYTGSNHFAWGLIEAIYTGKEFPEIDDKNTMQALIQLNEVNEIALNQLTKFKVGDSNQVEILNVADIIMEDLAKECDAVRPLVCWFLTEKTRVGPLSALEVVQKYKEYHFRLGRVLNLYIGSKWTKLEVKNEQNYLQER